MKIQIPIQALAIGMFVVADVRSEVVDGQMRYFLVARDAAYAAGYRNRRARLARNRHQQVARAGGMLITEEHHITALRAAGLSAVTIDTDMGDDAPDLPLADVDARLQKLERIIDSYQTQVVRAFRTLGLHDIDVSHFKVLIERTPRAEREPIMEVLHYLKKLARTRDRALQMRRELERQRAEGIESAEIQVSGTVLPDVEIRMGEQCSLLNERLSHTTFSLIDGAIERRACR